MALHLLAKLFSDSEHVARDLVEHANHAQQARTEYPRMLAQKQAALIAWDNGELQADDTLKQILRTEETVLGHSEDDEATIIRDLHALHRERGFNRVNEIIRSVGYAETGHQYVHDLLQQLHVCLLAQRALLKKGSLKEMRAPLYEQIVIEQQLIEHLNELPSFERLFTDILKGEAQIHRLTRAEHAIKQALFADGVLPGIERNEVLACIDDIELRLEDQFRQLEAEGKVNNHPDAHHQTSAHPSFQDVVGNVLTQHLGERATREVVNAFWFAFRETLQ
jgi:hypothetical protein